MTTFNFYPILSIVNVTVVAIRDKFEISVTQHSTILLFFFFLVMLHGLQDLSP